MILRGLALSCFCLPCDIQFFLGRHLGFSDVSSFDFSRDFVGLHQEPGFFLRKNAESIDLSIIARGDSPEIRSHPHLTTGIRLTLFTSSGKRKSG